MMDMVLANLTMVLTGFFAVGFFSSTGLASTPANGANGTLVSTTSTT
jgi:hypothetical protein